MFDKALFNPFFFIHQRHLGRTFLTVDYSYSMLENVLSDWFSSSHYRHLPKSLPKTGPPFSMLDKILPALLSLQARSATLYRGLR
jgi:hypothetical protein